MVSRADVVNGLLDTFPSRVYLEVGVSSGETFFAIRADRKVAVDPEFRFDLREARARHGASDFHEVTSDHYFAEIIDPHERFDVIYLDGLHTFEQTLRDFTNALHFLDQDGVIVIDDVIPNSYQAALPDQLDACAVQAFTGNPDNSWMGDTYKLVFFLRTFFPTWTVRTVEDNHGQAIVWRNPRALPETLPSSVRDVADLQFIDVVRRLDVFQRLPYAEILNLVVAERGGRSSTGTGEQRRQGRRDVPVKSLRTLATDSISLAASMRRRLERRLVFDNIAEHNAPFADDLARVYCDRVAELDPIDLVRLPSAMLLAGGDYITISQGSAIKEQLLPWQEAGPTHTIPARVHAEDVTAEVVLVIRYGVWTWGHWLGELLPKIAMVEADHPGRFTYAVPETYDDPTWLTLCQSIAAYGVTADRLLLVEPDRSYRLHRAFAVTSIWSDHLMHPAAARRMRDRLLPSSTATAPRSRIAIARPRSEQRFLENMDEITPLLTSRGFDIVNPLDLSFLDQVALFASAETVFSVLGSGLTGLIYAPTGVKVVSVAPSAFGDRFFYALVLDRDGLYADVRGPVTRLDPELPDRSPFTVDRARVEAALNALEARGSPAR